MIVYLRQTMVIKMHLNLWGKEKSVSISISVSQCTFVKRQMLEPSYTTK